jgi:hypothetical protein
MDDVLIHKNAIAAPGAVPVEADDGSCSLTGSISEDSVWSDPLPRHSLRFRVGYKEASISGAN